MKKAIEQAKEAARHEEVPVGAVLVLDDKIIGSGWNRVIADADPTAHAEITALRKAGKKLKNYRLTGCDLFVTLEPCLMCYSALVQARVKSLYFAAADEKTGVFSTGAYDRLPRFFFNHHIDVEAGLLQGESSRLLKEFFQERRGAGAVERDGLENR